MNLEGLEMIAVLVVVVLFVKVLEQFGLLETNYDGVCRTESGDSPELGLLRSNETRTGTAKMNPGLKGSF
ncbi:Kv channel-interacting protein 4-like isoform X3 [Arapaima gigas]